MLTKQQRKDRQDALDRLNEENLRYFNTFVISGDDVQLKKEDAYDEMIENLISDLLHAQANEVSAATYFGLPEDQLKMSWEKELPKGNRKDLLKNNWFYFMLLFLAAFFIFWLILRTNHFLVHLPFVLVGSVIYALLTMLVPLAVARVFPNQNKKNQSRISTGICILLILLCFEFMNLFNLMRL
ncbi:hypothetical protein GHI93_07465 [Lactococcus hircilactis]|uniref:DUF1129 family protein n=1 Tax=Lactococcus hircilactis TaxID=1494462 RepID=A0A7X1Z8G6_9LACT|nr:hypothetical protein [Lactococcus hircilactis]MQW39761.1 hypothetical protein [Lactococcus hircilactis]